MFSDWQLVYMVPRNSTELLNINTTKFQVDREPVYILLIRKSDSDGNWQDSRLSITHNYNDNRQSFFPNSISAWNGLSKTLQRPTL